MADGKSGTRIAAAVLVYMLAALPAGAKEFKAGAWIGDAYRDKDTGKFTHCAALAVYREKEYLVLGLTEAGNFYILLTNPVWNLSENDSYEVAVSIDSEPVGSFTATATHRDEVLIDVPDSEETLRLFGMGRILSVQAAKQRFVYGLDRAGAALAALQKCVSEERDPEPAVRGLFGGGGSLRSWSDQETDEARVKELLDGAGLSEFIFLSPAGRRGVLAQAYYAWVKDMTVGGYYAYDRKTTTLDAKATGTMLDYEDDCSGIFTFAVRDDKFASGHPAKRALATCDYGDNDIVRMSFLFFESDKIVIAIIHMSDISVEADLQRADEAMFRFFGAGQ